MVIHEKKAVFVHIPKTGGISVTHAILPHIVGYETSGQIGKLSPELKNRFEIRNAQKHEQAKYYVSKKHLTGVQWNAYYKFAIVRNPWDRAVSEFSWRHSLKNGWEPSTNFAEFLDYCQYRIENKPKRDIYWTHAQPQVDYVCDNKGNIILDTIYRFENLNDAVDDIGKKLGLSIQLEKHNSSKHKHYTEYYTKEFEKSVMGAHLCKKSGKKFGYDVKLQPSVFWKNLIEEVEKEGLKMKYQPHTKDAQNETHAAATRIANGLTHYRLYKNIVNIQKPMVILEHDSEFIGKLPEPIHDGVIQISSHHEKQWTEDSIFQCNRARKMIERGEEFRASWPETDGVFQHPLNGLNGTSGYVIGPQAAKKLVEVIEADGISFGDRIRTEYIGEGNLWLQKPQSVLCFHNRIKTAKLMK